MSTQSSQRSSQSTHELYSGSSYTLILQHILACPGTYEIPLRNMYALNSTPRAQPSRPATPTDSHDAPASPTSPFLPNAQFQSSLINQITSLPSQPASLPPSFITSFVSKCFTSELESVDFCQSLTALDYLKQLETRRRHEFAAALERLGIDSETIKSDRSDSVLKKHPGVAAWLKSSEDCERRVEQFYTQVFIALRRWVLINELSLVPFNQHNCLAMLNTLYPPLSPAANSSTPANQPTALLTQQMLKTQRSGFFEYIKKVETRGPACLQPLMQQGRRRARPNSTGEMVEDDTGWPAAKDCLDAYLRTANFMINDCTSLHDLQDFDHAGRCPRSYERGESRAGRKADSGVSFSSGDQTKRRPSTGSSGAKENQSPTTPSSYQAQFPAHSKTGATTLEKIARELRRMKIKRAESKSRPNTPSPQERLGRDHFRDNSDGSARTLVDDPPRPQSRAGSFVRSISRIRTGRSRSRSRPGTPAPMDSPIPPTPTIPTSYMEYDDDDDDDDEEHKGMTKLRRSLSMSRSKSSNGNKSNLLKKVKSMSDTKATGDERGRLSERQYGNAGAAEVFDPAEMRRQRERWEAKEQAKVSEFHAY